MRKILAAGCVVWRQIDSGEIQVALVHRTKYLDWSIPKGKLEEGESFIACAYRETIEETGFEVVVGPYLGKYVYEVLLNGEMRQKEVCYWSAEYEEELGTPNPAEVDEVRWVTKVEALQLLKRETEREVLDKFFDLDLDISTVILLRHAQAIDRKEWNGDDGDRPLAQIGTTQAKRLIPNLTPYGIKEIHTSTAIRCMDTVTPLARALDINYLISEDLGEYQFSRNPMLAEKYFKRTLMNDFPTLICSHNPILPQLLSHWADKSGFGVEVTKLSPADAWIIHHLQSEIIAVDYLPAPAL